MKNSRGFTLIEIGIAIAIMLLGLAIFQMSVKGLAKGADVHAAENTLLRSLEMARSRAIAGAGTDDHGVYIEAGKATIFEGASYPGSGAEQPFAGTVSAAISAPETETIPLEVVFTRISGASSVDTTVTLSNGAESADIRITHDGYVGAQ